MAPDASPTEPSTAEAGRTSSPRSAAELTRRNIDQIISLEAAAKAKATTSDRIADVVTSFVGSIRFVCISVVLVAGWVVMNMVALPRAERVDPFPFPLLTLALSVEAILLGIFILMSQNLAAQISDRRSHLDLQLNLLSEQENTKMLQMLEQIGKAVGADFGAGGALRALEEATRPEAISDQLDRAEKAAESRDERPVGDEE